jgi:hypothetical protein
LKYLLPIIYLFFVADICYAQDTAVIQPWQGAGIEVNVLGARVLKHEAKFNLPIPAVSTVTELNFIQKTWGKKIWQEWRNYPTIGLGFAYTNYGVDSVYGVSFSLYPNITLRLIKGKNIEWTLRLGEGLGYITKSYSRVPPLDTINRAISAHLNGYSSILSDVRYHVNDHLDIQAGINLTHISNSSLRKPNLGVNLYGVHVGVRYFPVTSRPVHVVREPVTLCNRWLLQARGAMGVVSAWAPFGPTYPVYSGTVYGSKRWQNKNKLLAGIDYSYHGDIYAYLHNNGLAAGHETWQASKSGVYVGNEFLLGRIGIVAQLGAYIKYAYLRKDDLYEKVGCNVYLVQRETGPFKEVFLSVFLKTHLNVAELAEVGMGVGI